MHKSILPILVKRGAASLLILFLLISFVFILLRLSPGDPVQKFVSPEISKEAAEQVRESFGLNDPVWKQYSSFVMNLFTGNLGVSYNYRAPVISVIMDYLPFTMIFAFISLLFQLAAGYFFAKFTFTHARTDKYFSGIGLAVYSLPSFVVALILIYLFSIHLNLLPTSGLRSINFDSFSVWGKITDYILHMILPVFTLSLYGIVVFQKYLRDNFDTVSKKLFVHYLRANGFDEKRILKKHIVKNSIGPMISAAGVELGVLLGGALITEVVFSLPGMGRLTVNAILMRDYPLVVGSVIIAGVLVVVSNFIADLLRAIIDKRVIEEILA